MSKLTVQTLVAAPPDAVFAVYTDLPKAFGTHPGDNKVGVAY